MIDSLWSLCISREWEEIKRIITVAAAEAVGKRNKNFRNRGLKAWNNTVVTAMKENEAAYMKYRFTRKSRSLQTKKFHCKTRR
jgi:hypothetical protein